MPSCFRRRADTSPATEVPTMTNPPASMPQLASYAGRFPQLVALARELLPDATAGLSPSLAAFKVSLVTRTLDRIEKQGRPESRLLRSEMKICETAIFQIMAFTPEDLGLIAPKEVTGILTPAPAPVPTAPAPLPLPALGAHPRVSVIATRLAASTAPGAKPTTGWLEAWLEAKRIK